MKRKIKLNITDQLDLTGSASTREITKEGYLKGIAAVTKVGVQLYSASDFGIDSDEMVGVFRPPETVFHTQTQESIKQQPLTMTHPQEDVNSENHNRLSVGSTGEKVGPIDEERLGVNFVVNNKDIVDGIISGDIGELSLGYDSFIISEEGSYNGESFVYRFDGPMICNHLAVLRKGDGRCGESVKILDSGEDMFTKKIALKLLKDAGCPADKLKAFMKDAKDEDEADQTAFLAEMTAVASKDMDVAPLMPLIVKELKPTLEKVIKENGFKSALAKEVAATMTSGASGDDPMDSGTTDIDDPPADPPADPIDPEDEKTEEEKKKEMDSKVKDAAAKRVSLITLATPFLAQDAKVNDMSDREILEAALKAVGFEDCKDLSDDQLTGRLDVITHDRIKAADSFKRIADGASDEAGELSAPLSALDLRSMK